MSTVAGDDGRAGLDGVSLDGARRRDRRHRRRLRQRPGGACRASSPARAAARRRRRHACRRTARWLDPRAWSRAGVARIPEDRHHEGVVGALSVAENLALETLAMRPCSASASCASARCAAARRDAIARLRRPLPRPRRADPPSLRRQHPEGDPGARARAASARACSRTSRRAGLDVGATAEVHRRLLDARARGVGDRADLRGPRRVARALRPHRRDRPAAASRRRSPSRAHPRSPRPDDGRARARRSRVIRLRAARPRRAAALAASAAGRRRSRPRWRSPRSRSRVAGAPLVAGLRA